MAFKVTFLKSAGAESINVLTATDALGYLSSASANGENVLVSDSNGSPLDVVDLERQVAREMGDA